jgi:competence protein ComFC
MKIVNCLPAGKAGKLKIKDTLLDILFPKFCIGCGRKGKYICERCNIFTSEVEPIYFQQEKYGLDSLISIWEYEGLMKKAIHQIKYQGVTDIIKELVSLINIEIESNSGLRPVITYVPMYKKREKKRGFNQAKIIAQEIAKKTNCQVVSLLKKIKDTKPQMELKQKERLENIKGCFELSLKEVRPPQNLHSSFQEVGPLKNLSVLLVDDVYTTGATMRECAKVLKKAGVKKVIGFVLARTA